MRKNSNLLFLVVFLLLVVAFQKLNAPAPDKEPGVIPYSEFLTKLEIGAVVSAELEGDIMRGNLRDGSSFKTRVPPNDAFLADRLERRNVRFSVNAPPEPSLLGQLFLALLPFAILVVLWVVLIRWMAKSGGPLGRMQNFVGSKAKLLTWDQRRVTFADVAGIDEAKEEVREIVEYLRDPRKFQALGAKIPKGVLLIGPTGTGKTLLARAVAGEANVPFLTISGSDFVEMFVGVGASRVREMFEQAKKNAPCIVFIDEIDAVGRHRGAGLGGGNDEREQTLNQILVEMDGFDTHEAVIIVAATNRPDILDPALLRPGRFDRQVTVPLPDVVGREKILAVHVRGKPIAPDVDLKVIARGTVHFSGADLANLVNEALLFAARRNKKMAARSDFEDAKDKVMMGTARRSLVVSDEDKKITAYHEAGHAIVGLRVPGNEPVHKVTIIPRGRALGMTLALPERDRFNYTKDQLNAQLAMMFGGRKAEEIIFGKSSCTTGAASDIEKATELARRMVTEWGFSSLGPIRFSASEREIFLGRAITERQQMSEQTMRRIDDAVEKIVKRAQETAEETLLKHREELDRLAEALLQYETLTGSDEIERAMRGETIVRTENEWVNESIVPASGPPKKAPEGEPSGVQPENDPDAHG
ncbi:MAG: ATP-dependent metallopeptidase FtsH/Yme1/Tma family protein [Parcubacteria group bacterium]|nr:ATP-dependent metallopeptidase FtsH/Yme1/Tma family protein [Parcubacteria group bacterium]